MKTHVHINTYTEMFPAALFLTATKWKQHKYPSTSRINITGHIHTMECYLAMKEMKY